MEEKDRETMKVQRGREKYKEIYNGRRGQSKCKSREGGSERNKKIYDWREGKNEYESKEKVERKVFDILKGRFNLNVWNGVNE